MTYINRIVIRVVILVVRVVALVVLGPVILVLTRHDWIYCQNEIHFV